MGKFDKRAVGEKDGERAPMGKRRKLSAVVDKSGKERSSQASYTSIGMPPPRTLLSRIVLQSRFAMPYCALSVSADMVKGY